jgi:uncharacterized SAM-binding protein YcdF (DUF218 family)
MGMRLKLLGLSAAFFFWAFGLIDFYYKTQQFSDQNFSADGIVILTGGKERIQKGMALFQKLKAKRVLISGVDKIVKLEIIKAKQLKGYDDFHQFTDLGYGAVNTFSNALEAATWVKQHDFKSIALVTSHFHMPRSFWLFTKTMPEIEIFPISVDGDDSSFIHLLREFHKFYLTKVVSKFLLDTDTEIPTL